MSEELQFIEKRLAESMEKFNKAFCVKELTEFEKNLYAVAFWEGSAARGEAYAITKRIVAESMK